ncbi:MAG: SMP-30/gluconolactonase/LRE family protein [Spirochaetes bacterium]|nr:SMP-30/gluconolactonase/LRE family protein [Spirochaetota bacterium]
MKQAEHLLPVQNLCGEIPNWIPEKKELYWSDFDGKKFFTYAPASGDYRSYNLEHMIGGWGRRKAGGWIVSTERGIAYWDEQTLDFELLVDPDGDKENIMCGDAAVDRQGRFLVGTMDIANFDAPNSSLFSYFPDGTLKRLDTGFALSNGIGFSPAGDILYFTDMFHSSILFYTYDRETGEVGNRRVFVEVPKDRGLPDGLIVDAEGFVWSCHWGGWRVTRYTPDGKVERTINLPVSNVTCCAFGGDDLSELYITTAKKGLSDQERADQPLAGDLFRVETDVQGLVEPKFGG